MPLRRIGDLCFGRDVPLMGHTEPNSFSHDRQQLSLFPFMLMQYYIGAPRLMGQSFNTNTMAAGRKLTGSYASTNAWRSFDDGTMMSVSASEHLMNLRHLVNAKRHHRFILLRATTM